MYPWVEVRRRTHPTHICWDGLSDGSLMSTGPRPPNPTRQCVVVRLSHSQVVTRLYPSRLPMDWRPLQSGPGGWKNSPAQQRWVGGLPNRIGSAHFLTLRNSRGVLPRVSSDRRVEITPLPALRQHRTTLGGCDLLHHHCRVDSESGAFRLFPPSYPTYTSHYYPKTTRFSTLLFARLQLLLRILPLNALDATDSPTFSSTTALDDEYKRCTGGFRLDSSTPWVLRLK